jgi:hypothetical protein
MATNSTGSVVKIGTQYYTKSPTSGKMVATSAPQAGQSVTNAAGRTLSPTTSRYQVMPTKQPDTTMRTKTMSSGLHDFPITTTSEGTNVPGLGFVKSKSAITQPQALTPTAFRSKQFATTPKVQELGVTTFQADPLKERLTFRLEVGDPSLTSDELSTARDYLADKMMYQRSQDPAGGYQGAINKLQQEYDRQIKAQEQERLRREKELAARDESELGRFAKSLDVAYEPEVQSAITMGEQQKKDVRNVLSFQGFGRSTTAIQKVDDVQRSIDGRVRAIEAAKAAEIMRFEAQQRGASAEELMGMSRQIQELKQRKNDLALEAIQKTEELRMEAMEKGNQIAVAQLDRLQQSMVDETIDMAASQEHGFLIDRDGQPMYNESGNLIELPDNALQIKQIGKNQYAKFNPRTGELEPISGYGGGGASGGAGRGGYGSREIGDSAIYEEIDRMVANNPGMTHSEAAYKLGYKKGDALKLGTETQQYMANLGKQFAAEQEAAAARERAARVQKSSRLMERIQPFGSSPLSNLGFGATKIKI